jgi:hypothetical protein
MKICSYRRCTRPQNENLRLRALLEVGKERKGVLVAQTGLQFFYGTWLKLDEFLITFFRKEENH